jgi:anti-anti-sigma factor
MMSSELVITKVADATIADFRNAAVLDGETVERIGNALYKLVDGQAQRKIVLDFTNVRFLSSTMLGVVIALHKKAAAIKGKVVICGLKPDLYKVFKIMKLDKLLKFAPDEHDALEMLDVFRKQ